MTQGKRRSIEITFKSRRSGCWYFVMLTGGAVHSDALVSLAVDDGGPARRFIPLRLGGRILAQVLLICVPAEEQRAVIEVFGEDSEQGVKFRLIAVPQAVAALMLLGLQPSILWPGASAKRMGGRTSLRQRLA